MALGSSVAAYRDYGGPKQKSPLEKMYDTYGTAVDKQASDYDTIMGNYDEIYKRSMDPNQGMKFNPIAGPERVTFNPIRAEQTAYNMAPDTRAALDNLKELSETGGLSAADQANLRARGISPIRAMYATGQRDMERQRRLQGGYSPNFGAVTAKMTRDRSSMIADQMDKVNANIAEMVQTGKLSAAPNYASAAQAESALKTGVDKENTALRQDANKTNAAGLFDAARFNAQSTMDVNKFNASGSLDAQRQNRSDALGAIQGKTNLYGTTPALANLYGNQARNDRDFEAGEDQRKITNTAAALGRMYRA